MSRRLTVRLASAEDASSIGAVFDAAVSAGWSCLGALARTPMFEPAEWDRLVAEHAPPSVLLVAANESEAIVGFVAAHPEDGELFPLFIHPASAGRGIGRPLLEAAHDRLRAAGCRHAFLFTHERNERALAVDAAVGYRPDGTIGESDFRGTAIRELRLVS